jgi:predicted nucleotidyltransferase
MEIRQVLNLNELHEIFRAHHVERAELFGSAVIGAFSGQSDVDILVTFSEALPFLDDAENFFELMDKLELKSGQTVDLVSITSLKNRALIDYIKHNKRLIYSSS